MFQKEVAERVCAPPGSKVYGILSALLQNYYTCEYAFTVGPGAFLSRRPRSILVSSGWCAHPTQTLTWTITH